MHTGKMKMMTGQGEQLSEGEKKRCMGGGGGGLMYMHPHTCFTAIPDSGDKLGTQKCPDWTTPTVLSEAVEDRWRDGLLSLLITHFVELSEAILVYISYSH